MWRTITVRQRTARSNSLATLGLIEYEDAGLEARAVFDDIRATRKTDWINNFWKALVNDPGHAPDMGEHQGSHGAWGSDPLTKELIYVAVSVDQSVWIFIASHSVSAHKKGMTNEMFAELMAIVGMANETNRLASGYQVEIDPEFQQPLADDPATARV